ncbi:MAG: DUF6017 domain-containing protein [Oscillospiraceae bacterium]
MAQQPIPHDYFYAEEAEQFVFYRLPKALFTNNHYKYLSGNAKILYGMMLDRMGWSLKNGWLDDNGRVFIYFTLEDVQEHINCQRDLGMKLLAELDSVKGVGLIERVRQGLGKPAKIYVKKFINNADFKKSEKPTSGLQDLPTSGLRQDRPTDYGDSDSIKNEFIKPENNNTDFSENYPIQSYQRLGDPAASSLHGWDRDGMRERNAYRDLITDNVEYDILIGQYGEDRMNELVEIMLDTVCSKRDYITIAGDDYPKEVVKSRFLKIDSSHIQYAFDCIDKNTTKVRNVRKYLLATLYNAPTTMDTYYRAEVNHDLYGGGD